MAQFLRRVVTSLGFLPAIKSSNLCENDSSLSPGSIMLSAATNHYMDYMDINTVVRLTLLILQNTSAKKMPCIIPRILLLRDRKAARKGRVSQHTVPGKCTGFCNRSPTRQSQGLMTPYLHRANMILIAISIKSWLNLFHYFIWPLQKVSCTAALPLSLFFQPKQQSISYS